ncbi:hypothetical protein [Ilumatobacter coccineus]|uniref:Uncharacterized protein n=1 Tax=Ilumatobacter coccineus (strain NBRC 103263 / KCTC 29153 / YM16-304) TaxID=1313172 RepID=A0A6C7E926_ILUCY|nr:hypothetical protein [Ilumatobacter coccineus]BAN00546.1 hypothetical protein YM304_02320 [Ilumatobacter coccineus YM16-304]
MTAVISRAVVVGGHDGRAEIEVEITYDNGGTATISLDEEACTASLDRAGICSIDELVGQPWSVVLPALGHDTNTPSTPDRHQGVSS